jgi:hypothetical protein
MALGGEPPDLSFGGLRRGLRVESRMTQEELAAAAPASQTTPAWPSPSTTGAGWRHLKDGNPAQESLALSGQLGERIFEASAIHYVGVVQMLTGNCQAAAASLRQAHALNRLRDR